MNLLVYFLTFLKASLFSSGGTGNLPSLQHDLVAPHVAADRQFAEALLIGQLSPGPNGLWSVSLGFLTHGLIGAVLALIALTLPPLLVLVVERLYSRVESHPAVEGFMRGLSLAIAGISGVILIRLLANVGFDGRSIVLAGGAAALGMWRRFPLNAVLAIAAVAGIVLYSH